MEAFGNSLSDSVSFRVPSWQSLGGPQLPRQGRQGSNQTQADYETGYTSHFAVDFPVNGLLRLPYQVLGGNEK
jgi:hypothetical protein